MRIIWTRQAVEDVEAIKAYVGRDSPRYAAMLVERLVAAVGRLDSFPQSGRVVPEVRDECLREVIHGNYRLVYRLEAETAKVITVYHVARLFRQ
jgi:addiction module RelE/StbE family toxin